MLSLLFYFSALLIIKVDSEKNEKAPMPDTCPGLNPTCPILDPRSLKKGTKEVFLKFPMSVVHMVRIHAYWSFKYKPYPSICQPDQTLVSFWKVILSLFQAGSYLRQLSKLFST